MHPNLERLIDIVKQLRAPNGCPWDREQTHGSLLPCLIEECYELVDAIEADNTVDMQEELGDVLLQVVLHAQIASESGRFALEDIAGAISEKLIHRHPHIFGDVQVSSSAEVLANWEQIKAKEKQHRLSLVDEIPLHLPALQRAEKIQRRVAKVGFDWTEQGPILDKVEEEFAEFRQALEAGDSANAQEELGDILFALVNLGRHHGIGAEEALRSTIGKFERRFRYIEQAFERQGSDIAQGTLEQMDALWEECKRGERARDGGA